MKAGKNGFAFIELLISVSVAALASGAAGAAIFQITKNSERVNDRLNAVRQVQNAGYWISRDAQMALNITPTDNLTSPDFLVLNWTTWNAASDPVNHSVTYQFESPANASGALIRNYWNSEGANMTSRIARYIYFDLSDIARTSNSSYQSPVLTLKLTSVFEGIMETREYRIKRRTNLF